MVEIALPFHTRTAAPQMRKQKEPHLEPQLKGVKEVQGAKGSHLFGFGRVAHKAGNILNNDKFSFLGNRREEERNSPQSLKIQSTRVRHC